MAAIDVAVLVVTRDGTPTAEARSGAADVVAVIDPQTSRVVDRVHVGRTPTIVAVGYGGAWVLNKVGTPTANPPFSDASMEDSTANWHGSTSTFSFADAHAESHKWMDGPTLVFASSMIYGKASQAAGSAGGPPTFAQAPHDVYFLANGFANQLNP